MSENTDTDDAVAQFLSDADAAFSEYEKGYADADATLRRLRTDIESLREAVED
jgi:hypothetical protein